MPGIQLGFLKFVLGLDTLSFNKGASDAEVRLKAMQRSFEGFGAKMAIAGAGLTALTSPLIGFAKRGVEEAEKTAKAMGQVNAALASMGPVAGRTAQQLSAAADAFEGSSLFEADDILKKVTANMLTFGNIAGANFDKAQQAAIDLSARLGQDLQSSAIQVGKALNDPIKGVTALRRVGVQFTADQRDQIKAMVESGNTAGAQALILKELAKEFGGAAQAAQNTDPYNKMHDALKNASEVIGTALLPLIPPVTNAIASVAQAFTSLSPATQKWVLIVGGAAVVLGPMLVALGAVTAAFGALIPLLMKVGPAWELLKAGMLAARVAAISTLPALVPFLVPLAAIAAAVGVAYLAWKNWDKISAIAAGVWTAVKGFIVDKLLPTLPLLIPGLGAVYLAWKNWDKVKTIVSELYAAVKSYLVDKLGAVFTWVSDKAKAVGDAFFTLYDRVVGHSYVPDMVEGIRIEMAKLDAVMVAPATAATGKASAAFQKLQADAKGLQDLLGRLFPESAATGEYLHDLSTLQAAFAKGAISADEMRAAIKRLNDEKGQQGVNVAALSPEPILSSDLGLPTLDDGARSFADTMELVGQRVDAALGQIPGLASQATNALAEISARGLDNVAGGLAAVITGSAKLADVFRSTVNGMIADLSRYLIKEGLIKLISLFAGGTPGAGSFGASLISSLSGARALGGPVNANGAYLVGERGPEIFTPDRSGAIVPNNKMSGFGGADGRSITQINNFALSDYDSFRRSERQIAGQAKRRLARV